MSDLDASSYLALHLLPYGRLFYDEKEVVTHHHGAVSDLFQPVCHHGLQHRTLLVRYQPARLHLYLVPHLVPSGVQ